MITPPQAIGIEINPKLIGVLFTEKIGDTLRIFCFYTNAVISQFDVPADENADNLKALFTALGMEDTCTSLVLEEVVQGRVFLKKENQHQLYTVLKCPGDKAPPLNADIAELPWRMIWRTQESEVLEYANPETGEHGIAIRTHISENDATRLIQHSKSFTRPASIPRKKPHRWVYLNIGLALLATATLVGGTIYYTFRENRPAAVPPTVASPASGPAVAVTNSVAPTTGYYLLYNRKISGPYPVKVIADMRTSGLLNAETLCRHENSTDWIKLADLSLLPPQK